VGIGNRYPRQLLNKAVHRVLLYYTTKLPKIMDLDGGWEIGLAEIQFPHSWYNVKNKEAWLKVHFYKESQHTPPPGIYLSES
jgi:hypothetical protein